MDKDNNVLGYNHNVTINERKNLTITGLKKVDSFDSMEFLLDTNLGYIIIKGEELEIVKLDTFQGNISIKGKINSLEYTDKDHSKKNKDDSLFNKLFK